MSLIKKYPLPAYDPPVRYDQFNGGINTSLSNEVLQPNELRDGLNCHYKNSALINRPGARRLAHLNFPDNFSSYNKRFQGDFIFSAIGKDWVISVRDGFIFYGEYIEDNNVINYREIDMHPLIINMKKNNINLIDLVNEDVSNNIIDGKIVGPIDSHNTIIGLPIIESDTDNIFDTGYTDTNHEGFIHKYFEYVETSEGETVKSDLYTLVVQNAHRVQGVQLDNYFLLATGTRLIRIYEKDSSSSPYLYAEIMPPKVPNAYEFVKIGVNNLSPFPGYHIQDSIGAPLLQIGYIKTDPLELSLDYDEPINIEAVCSYPVNTIKSDFYFKWEIKYVKWLIKDNGDWMQSDSDWFPIIKWLKEDKTGINPDSKNASSISYTMGELLECMDNPVLTERPDDIDHTDQILIRCTITNEFEQTYDVDEKKHYYVINDDGDDLVSDQAIAHYSRTHITKYLGKQNEVDQYFYIIHSSRNIIADGMKALLYNNAYDEHNGEWVKTVVGKYDYISYSGGLSFRTTKDEKITAVVVFDSNIVVFADNPRLGGNISIVTGNGDDYKEDEYYSPYKKTIVNTSISCDCYNSVQICDNNVIFKYRDNMYILDTADLSNSDIVVIESINDKVKQRLNDILMPLDKIQEPARNISKQSLEWDFHKLYQLLTPEEIFSYVNDGVYHIIFPHHANWKDALTIPPEEELFENYQGPKESYEDYRIENISIKPSLSWKCYFREGQQYTNMQKVSYPWLRDASTLLDITSIIQVDGKTALVRENNDIIIFDNEDGSSYTDENFLLRVITKAYDMENPALCKFLDNACIYYNRDFNDVMDIKFRIINEAAYEIYGPENEAYVSFIDSPGGTIKYDERYKFDEALNLKEKDLPLSKYQSPKYVDDMDKPVEVLDEYEGVIDGWGEWMSPTLNRPYFTSRTLTPRWRFPFLSASVKIELTINQAFALSAINFSYTSSDMPDFTRERLYREIIR